MRTTIQARKTCFRYLHALQVKFSDLKVNYEAYIRVKGCAYRSDTYRLYMATWKMYN